MRDVIAEDGPRVGVRLFDGRAGEADEGGIRQCVAQVAGEPRNRRSFNHGRNWLRWASSAITTMFCRALSRGMLSPFSGMNFWIVVNTTPPLATMQQFAQMLPARGLHRRLAEYVRGIAGTGRKAGRQDRCGRSARPASGSASPDAARCARRRRAWRSSCRSPACARPRPARRSPGLPPCIRPDQ